MMGLCVQQAPRTGSRLAASLPPAGACADSLGLLVQHLSCVVASYVIAFYSRQEPCEPGNH